MTAVDDHVGSADCYKRGCRLAQCRAQHARYMRIYRTQRERRGGRVTHRTIIGGHLYADAAITIRQVRSLFKVMPGHRIAAETGLNVHTIWEINGRSRPPRRVTPYTAETISALWNVYCAPVRCRYWSTGPLRTWMETHRHPPLCDPDRRATYRQTVTDRVAERICMALGVDPWDIWEDWYDLD